MLFLEKINVLSPHKASEVTGPAVQPQAAAQHTASHALSSRPPLLLRPPRPSGHSASRFLASRPLSSLLARPPLETPGRPAPSPLPPLKHRPPSLRPTKPVRGALRTSPRQLLSRQQLPHRGNQSPVRECADSAGSGSWSSRQAARASHVAGSPRSPAGSALSHRKRLSSASLPLVPSTWNLQKTKISPRFPVCGEEETNLRLFAPKGTWKTCPSKPRLCPSHLNRSKGTQNSTPTATITSYSRWSG